MKARHLCILACSMTTLLLASCQRDTYGKLFVKREPVTFRVQSIDGQALSGVSLKTEELDGFDGDLIVDGTHYAYTDQNGLVTIKAVYNKEPGYSRLGERTTRFTFTATDYIEFDTIFNYWEDTVSIVLHWE